MIAAGYSALAAVAYPAAAFAVAFVAGNLVVSSLAEPLLGFLFTDSGVDIRFTASGDATVSGGVAVPGGLVDGSVNLPIIHYLKNEDKNFHDGRFDVVYDDFLENLAEGTSYFIYNSEPVDKIADLFGWTHSFMHKSDGAFYSTSYDFHNVAKSKWGGYYFIEEGKSITIEIPTGIKIAGFQTVDVAAVFHGTAF